MLSRKLADAAHYPAIDLTGSISRLAQTLLDPTRRQGAVMLDHMVNQQAQIVAYANDYMLLIMTTIPALLLLLLMRVPAKDAVPAK